MSLHLGVNYVNARVHLESNHVVTCSSNHHCRKDREGKLAVAFC